MYVRDIGTGGNSSPQLEYTVNGGSTITLGLVVSSTCALLYNITGLSSGNSIQFSTAQTYAMSGTSGASACPAVGGSGTYTYTMVSGENPVSISINRDTIV